MSHRKPLDLMQKWLVYQHWVGQRPHLTRSALVVLCCLLQRQNVKDGRCDPSAARLMRDTGLCERSVRNAISELDARGALIRSRVASGYRNKYLIFSCAELAQFAAQQQSAVHLRAEDSAPKCRNIRHDIAPKKRKKRKKKSEGMELRDRRSSKVHPSRSCNEKALLSFDSFEKQLVRAFESQGLPYDDLLRFSAEDLEAQLALVNEGAKKVSDVAHMLIQSVTGCH